MNTVSFDWDILERQRLTTILSVDICAYSQIAERDEIEAIKAVELVTALFDSAVGGCRGRIFNIAGDGLMAEFPSVQWGVRSAQSFLKSLKSPASGSRRMPQIAVRMGLHVGDVTEQPNGDLLGHGVNIAARLQQNAEPNGILISQQAANHLRGRALLDFRPVGEVALKNIDEIVSVYEFSPQTAGEWKRPNLLWRVRKRIKRALLLLASALAIPIMLTSSETGGANVNLVEDKITALIKAIDSKPFDDVRPILEDFRSLPLHKRQKMIEEYRKRIPINQALKELDQRLDSLMTNSTPSDSILLLEFYAEAALEEKPTAANRALRVILSLNSEHVVAHYLLGKQYLELNELAQAEWHLERALRLSSSSELNYATVQAEYAVLLIKNGQKDLAIPILNEAAHTAEKYRNLDLYSIARNRVAAIHLLKGDLDSAKEILDDLIPIVLSIENTELIVDSYLRLGFISRVQRNIDDEFEYYLSVLKQVEFDSKWGTDLAFLLARTASEGHKLETTTELFTGALERPTTDKLKELRPLLILGLATAYIAKGDTKKACELVDDLDFAWLIYNHRDETNFFLDPKLLACTNFR